MRNDISDLERASACLQEALRLTPDGHAHKATLTRKLGNVFLIRFRVLGELSDLQQAISMFTLAVQRAPVGHPTKAGCLNDLANSFFAYFKRTGELNDLDLAISNYERAEPLIQEGDKPGHLSSFGDSLLARFHRLKRLGDLDRAIAKYTDAVRLNFDGHRDKFDHINKLGNSFICRFEMLREAGDLEQAISTYTSALEFISESHPNGVGCMRDLDETFIFLERLCDLKIKGPRKALEHTWGDHPDTHKKFAAYHMTCLQHLMQYHFFPLIIGISNNQGPNAQSFCRGVNDAKAMKRYLQEDLKVPKDHIRTLFDSEATRNAITTAFQDLRDDQRINSGDAIMIFYRGCMYKPFSLPVCPTNERTTCLISQDYGVLDDGQEIPRGEIRDLTADISKAKGENVTVILNCCHSTAFAEDLASECCHVIAWRSGTVTNTTGFAQRAASNAYINCLERTASEIDQRPAPSYALIIGIDDYAHVPKLKGAVADAKAMKQHFEEVLHMPSERIRTLYNEEATRTGIIQAFEDLRSDHVKVNKGDPIVVFYAGRGGELNAPSSWSVHGKIQSLIPQDCQFELTEDSKGIQAVKDHEPIPDRTIGVFLEDIAKLKGDNITVIFDCCYAAPDNREDEKIEYVVRSVNLDKISISEDVDGPIWRGRAGKVHDGFMYHGLRSHVLLAACREKEKAYEHEERGQFTRALLKEFQYYANNKLDLSYTEVLERIHLNRDQHPQCEDLNRHRVLFDTRVPAGRQVWYEAQAVERKYIIGAGAAHSVARGVEFSLYDSEKRWLGIVLVDESSTINDFETIIPSSHVLRNALYAKVTRVGKVPIYIGNNPELEVALMKMEENAINAPKFRIVGELAQAKLHIAVEDHWLVFKILDERVRRLGLTELPYKTTFESLAHVLPAAAHFFWYLDLANKNNRLGTHRDISVDFHLLNLRDFGMPYLFPIDSGYRRQDPHSGDSDMIEFVVNPARRYGIEINNHTKKDLYLNAFLFNNSNLSVVCYTQSSAGEPEAPLKQGGTFTVGYGDAGTPPLSFSLEEGQDVDVSFLKVFLATRPIDLSDIEQPSPFLRVHPPPMHVRRWGETPKIVSPAHDIWFTTIVPVVQRRRA